MTEKEMMQRNIEEFARLQDYMVLTQEKVILQTSGVNLTELDIIKEKVTFYVT